jgi:cell wall-associated NlpC family hydrolase
MSTTTATAAEYTRPAPECSRSAAFFRAQNGRNTDALARRLAHDRPEPTATFTGGGVCDGGDGSNRAGVPLPAGFTLPADTPASVVAAIAWALAQRGTPYTFGGDCTAPHSGVAAHQCDCSSLVQQAYRAVPARVGGRPGAGPGGTTVSEAEGRGGYSSSGSSVTC